MKNLFNFCLYLIIPLLIYYNVSNCTYINNKADYMFSIYIPKINLSSKVYSHKCEKNNVNKNIYLANNYDLDKQNGSMVLAAHSGNSVISYFDDIDILRNDDDIIVEDALNIYSYKVDSMFNINKTGIFNYQNKDRYIYLVTCSKKDKRKQLVIGAKLEKITKKSTFY